MVPRAPRRPKQSTHTNPSRLTLQLQRGGEVTCLLQNALPGVRRDLLPPCHHLDLHGEGSDDGIVIIDGTISGHHLGAVWCGEGRDDRSDPRDFLGSAVGCTVTHSDQCHFARKNVTSAAVPRASQAMRSADLHGWSGCWSSLDL